MASLSDEQKRRMEENRRKAQALRAAKQKQVDSNGNSSNGIVRNTSSCQGHQNTTSGQFNSASNPARTFSGGTAPQRQSGPSSFNSTRPTAPPSSSSGGSHGSFYSTNKSVPSSTKSGPRPPNPNPNFPVQSSNQNAPSSSSLTAAQQRQGLHTSSQALQKIMGSPSKIAPTRKAVRVSGKCVLRSRSRFEVQVNYHAGAVEVFKTMDTKMYGKYINYF